jgi:hypothetical protein
VTPELATQRVFVHRFRREYCHVKRIWTFVSDLITDDAACGFDNGDQRVRAYADHAARLRRKPELRRCPAHDFRDRREWQPAWAAPWPNHNQVIDLIPDDRLHGPE